MSKVTKVIANSRKVKSNPQVRTLTVKYRITIMTKSCEGTTQDHRFIVRYRTVSFVDVCLDDDPRDVRCHLPKRQVQNLAGG